MRMSELFIRTLREVPAEATLPGYQLLLRSGLVRLVAPGSYCFLPLGVRVRQKIVNIVCRAIQSAGGQAISLPYVQPAYAGFDLEEPGVERTHPARFRDRAQNEVCLATSNEAAVTSIARHVIQSYRNLPVFLYQVWQPFHDTERFGSNLFGAREALVVDGYSFQADKKETTETSLRLAETLTQALETCGLSVIDAAKGFDDAGAPMFRSLIWQSDAGDKTIIHCPECYYAAEQSIARSAREPGKAEEALPRQDVVTPDCKTIADLATFLDIPSSRTAKALFQIAYVEDKGDLPVIAIVRGDTDLNEEKLKNVLHARTLGPATESEIEAMGAVPGYGSPIGLKNVTVVVDDLIPVSPNLVAGANRAGFHTLNVNLERDYQADLVADITLSRSGDLCPECGTRLEAHQGFELVQMADLGERYTQSTNASYLDPQGKPQPLTMGHCRIYVDRVLAAISESHYDEQGLTWPVSVAPYQVYLLTLGKQSESVSSTSDGLYRELLKAGIEVLLDDRDERAGVKFNDADLLGIPIRVVVGAKGLEKGIVEVKQRQVFEKQDVLMGDLTSTIKEMLG